MKVLPQCLILYILVICFDMCLQQEWKSHILLTNKGTTFLPKSSLEVPLTSLSTTSRLRCAQKCNENIFCRLFIYDEITLNCQLYQSDLSSGNITSNASSTSRVGIIQYQLQFYSDYNKTCNYCQFNRYLTCQNTTCQCPSPSTYWNGQMCQNKFYYGDTCNSSLQCRQDFNWSCIYGSCQPNTAFCKLGVTGITFDDIPNIDVVGSTIPSIYKGFKWTNGNYLNVSTTNGPGYRYALASGQYVAWFRNVLTIQTLLANTTMTLNTFVTAAGWSNTVSLTIDGYYSSTLLNTTTIALNTYTKNLVVLDWSGLNKIVFTSSASGSDTVDTGIDNLCITL